MNKTIFSLAMLLAASPIYAATSLYLKTPGGTPQEYKLKASADGSLTDASGRKLPLRISCTTTETDNT